MVDELVLVLVDDATQFGFVGCLAQKSGGRPPLAATTAIRKPARPMVMSAARRLTPEYRKRPLGG
jgi:hypothetical protein